MALRLKIKIKILTLFFGGGEAADGRAWAGLAFRGRTKARTISFIPRHRQFIAEAKVRSFSFAIVACATLAFSAHAFADPLTDEVSSQSAFEGTMHEVRGIIAAVNEATYTTDLNAPASKVSFREGDSFKKGDVLIAFDCRRQNALLQSLRASQKEMEVRLEGNVYLERRGAVGRRDLEVSRARANKAAHDAKALEVSLERCVIKAPFDGRIRALAINEHETPVSGKPILEIIGTIHMELQLIVPSIWLVWLEEGTEFSFKVDETGREYEARVRRIGAAVDPVSQTINLTGKFIAPVPKVRAGMSGTATFPHQGG